MGLYEGTIKTGVYVGNELISGEKIEPISKEFSVNTVTGSGDITIDMSTSIGYNLATIDSFAFKSWNVAVTGSDSSTSYNCTLMTKSYDNETGHLVCTLTMYGSTVNLPTVFSGTILMIL